MSVGILGYGEAGRRYAADLARTGVAVAVYSPSAAQAAPDAPLRRRALDDGVAIASSPREACARASVIISLAPGRAALPVLRSVRRDLRPDQLYVDATSASVKDMERAGAMLAGSAAFVDAAIMDPVTMSGLGVHTVASGERAGAFRDLLQPYGANIQVVGERPGAASAMKLLRSVCMKGLAALLLESLDAAHRYGITDVLAADMARFIDERPFEQVMKRFVCGTAVHASRRMHEMTEALGLLRSLGAPTYMTRGTLGMLKAVADGGLREHFGGREPDAMGPVLAALAALRSGRAAGPEASLDARAPVRP